MVTMKKLDKVRTKSHQTDSGYWYGMVIDVNKEFVVIKWNLLAKPMEFRHTRLKFVEVL